LRIHAVITRGIDIALQSKDKEGFKLFEESLYATINGHHKTEDEAVFPFFRDKMPGVPFDRLIADHHQLSNFVEQKDIVHLKALWIEHIKKEEHYFTQEKLDSVLDPDEQIKFRTEVGRIAGKHSQPPFLVMPLELYNLTDEERKIFAKNLPPDILKLVNTTWQEKWKPMESLFYSSSK
jgi:hypothetical protein